MENEENKEQKESDTVTQLKEFYEEKIKKIEEQHKEEIKVIKEDNARTIRAILSSGKVSQETKETEELDEEEIALKNLRKKFNLED